MSPILSVQVAARLRGRLLEETRTAGGGVAKAFGLDDGVWRTRLVGPLPSGGVNDGRGRLSCIVGRGLGSVRDRAIVKGTALGAATQAHYYSGEVQR